MTMQLIVDPEIKREHRYKIARLPYRDAIELFNRRLGRPFSCRIVSDVDPIPTTLRLSISIQTTSFGRSTLFYGTARLKSSHVVHAFQSLVVRAG